LAIHAKPQFEIILDGIRRAKKGVVGKILEVFTAGRPNINHRLLAQLGDAGCSLVTTNFDTCVEEAIESMFRKPARVIRTSRQARRFDSRGACVPLLKLHGCASKPTGIITTISAILRRGSMRSTSFLSPDRYKALRRFLQTESRGHLQLEPVCFVLGYSGSDDLDVVPALCRIKRCLLLRVRHTDGRPVDCAELDKLLAKPAPRGRAPREQWWDGELPADTTRFLRYLVTSCGLLHNPRTGRIGNPRKDQAAPIGKLFDRLSPAEARQVIAGILGKLPADNSHEDKARRYLKQLRKGKRPVLLGRSPLFSPDAWRLKKPRSIFRLGQLSPTMRAHVCDGVGRALARRGCCLPTARVMLGQAVSLWSVLNKRNQQLRADALLKSLGQARGHARGLV
jgi:hypothetical protein